MSHSLLLLLQVIIGLPNLQCQILSVTDQIELNNTIFYEINMNQSSPRSYVLTQLSTNQSPFVTAVDVDTLKPLVSEIAHNVTAEYIRIGDSVTFTVFPTYGDISTIANTPPLDLTSLILNIQYNDVSLVSSYVSTLGAYLATYTVSESHISRTAPIPLTNVFFTDSDGRIGSATALLELSSARLLNKPVSLVDPHYGIELTRIISGSFMMGSAVTEVYRDIDEFDQHQVTLTTDYFISNTEVTQSQWESRHGWCWVMAWKCRRDSVFYLWTKFNTSSIFHQLGGYNRSRWFFR